MHLPHPLQIALLAHGIDTKSAVLTASMRQGWNVRLLLSKMEAMRLLRSGGIQALLYDWHFKEDNWRELCRACVECDVAFQLLAGHPSDDLFLAVVAAGGSAVLRKPLTPERIASAIHFGQTLNAQPHGLRVGR
jgi:DNA-binding response OmpR family regulator